MAGTSVCWLPVEVVDNILSVALAEHFDSLLFGPDAHARLPFCRVDAEESTDIGRRDVAESLFLVSRQFHHITLHILSAAFGVPFRERASNTFSRLDDIPWIQLVGLRTLRDLLSERPSVVREVRQGALVLTPQRGVCAGYHTLVLRQLNTTLNRRRLKIFPCINTLQEIQRSHPMCAAEVERGSDIPPLPEAFSNVLLRGFEQAYADEAIFYGYDVYAMELELQWKLFLCTVTAERRDNSDALAQPCADRIREIVQHVRDTDSGLRRTWRYPVPLDRLLSKSKLAHWCTLLRRIVREDHPSMSLSRATDAARALLREFEPRLERLPQEEGVAGF